MRTRVAQARVPTGTRPARRKTYIWRAAAVAALIAGTASCTSEILPGDSTISSSSLGNGVVVGPQGASRAPSSGTAVCGKPILDSPYNYDGQAGTFTVGNAPHGLPTFGRSGTIFPKDTSIVVVPAGNNTEAGETALYDGNNIVYYFEPGNHIIQHGMYTGTNSVYIGGYNKAKGKAVLNGVDGGTRNGVGTSTLSLSNTAAANETWEYLTIENYGSTVNNAVLGNANSGGTTDSGNTYKYDTIGPNEYGNRGDVKPGYGESSGGGYAIDLQSNTTIEWNCMTHDAQGAFNGGGYNITISHNEISWNGLGVYPDDPGTGGSPYSCGCSGGGKLFFSVNAVITNNYVHNNYNVGIWLDFDNTGANISSNYVASNWGEGIMYEASYNASISNNTLVGNGWASNGAWPAGVKGGTCYQGVTCTDGYGPTTGAGGGNPYAAIDLSNSGGNGNLNQIRIPGCRTNCIIHSNYPGKLLVQGNVLINNFGGVKVYTDTNRFPDNTGNDSACSIPLGADYQSNSKVYYWQTKELVTAADAAVTGDSVTTAGGTQTLCSNYGQTQATETNGAQEFRAQAPSIGMAVFDQNTGQFLGTVASVTSANAFTLSKSPGNRTGAELLLSAYGGCGPADYFGGAPGKASGVPYADYWDNCLWGSRNVTVSGNTFVTQANKITGCDARNMCGYMADEAFNPGEVTIMRVFFAYTNLIAEASGGLNNVWSNNSYTWTGGGPGAWQFWAGSQGDTVSRGAWQGIYSQDAKSTFQG